MRLHVTSPQDLASRLTTSHHTPPNEAKLLDVLSKVEVLHGWVLNHESRVVDGHVVESSWHVFVFGLLSTFIVPSHMLHVASVLVDAIALRDLLLAFRCKHGQAFDTPIADVERDNLTIIALQSKVIQISSECPDMEYKHVSFHVGRYRDTLRAADEHVWLQHIFVPDISMLPSFLRILS